MSPHGTDLFALKTAWAGLGGLVLSAGGWVAAEVGTGTAIDVLLPATALTATATAFVWLVGLMASGRLVHRDTAEATSELARALQRSNDLATRGHEREDLLIDVLTKRRES